MGIRRKGREFALQALYLMDVAKLPIEQAVNGVVYGATEKDAAKFAKHLAIGTAEKRAELDAVILKCTKNWELERMAALDRNILRLGAYELLHETDTPVSVVIDEAVEIAKSFSTDDSGKFVNGILDKIKIDYARKAHS